jgi:hypothetical protein
LRYLSLISNQFGFTWYFPFELEIADCKYCASRNCVGEDESESEYDHQEAHTGGGALSLCRAEVEATQKRWRVLLNYLSAD